MGKVEKWIEAKKAAKAASGAQGKPRTAISVRVTDLRMGMLAELAKEMGMTRSGFAEQLIDLAITEAWEKYNGREASLGDIKRLEALNAQQQIKPPPEVPNVSLSQALLDALSPQSQPPTDSPNLTPLPQSLLEGLQSLPSAAPVALARTQELMTQFAMNQKGKK
ncbi:MAG: hypothetical protein JWN14_3903 [Chthonomonadales bacterium]|nr:hypothetical protein [Chthonomonadales bacterium]